VYIRLIKSKVDERNNGSQNKLKAKAALPKRSFCSWLIGSVEPVEAITRMVSAQELSSQNNSLFERATFSASL
jgi:hypothetical protein